MSLQGRNGATGALGTHYKNPLMVSGGPLDDIPRGVADRANSPYKIWYEDFAEQAANAQIETMGFTVTDINTPTSPTEVILPENRALFFNPGSKADSGVELQFNIASTAGSLGSTFKIMGEFLQTTTLMDGQEIFFQTRIGSVSDSATDNDSKYLLGFFQNDATLLDQATGLPIVVAGGGFGFHKGELGVVTGLSTNAAITAAGTVMVPAVSELAMTVTVPNWHTYAARCRVIDASAGTGFTDFWYDGSHRLRLSTIPFDATDTHSFTMALHNGPSQIADWHIDYILTGITRPGLTFPYTDGVIY